MLGVSGAVADSARARRRETALRVALDLLTIMRDKYGNTCRFNCHSPEKSGFCIS